MRKRNHIQRMLVLVVISVFTVLPAAADGNKKFGFDIGLSSGGIFMMELQKILPRLLKTPVPTIV